MTVATFRSAWTDPEFVRLASYRSWWDAGTSTRGPLADGENPWLTDEHPEVTTVNAAPVPRPRLARADEYASQRCSCTHIAYADEYDGGFCRFCKCSEHGAAS